MSGTSLDGLDMAYCDLWREGDGWAFDLQACRTEPYPKTLKSRLARATQSSALELSVLDIDLGRWFGEVLAIFIVSQRIAPDFISSHGHTIFHQPERKLTLQAGNAYEIMNACQIPVISDFRSLDVCIGGQGAPLVPMGDRLFFNEYDFCLNLGGIANVTLLRRSSTIAFDICPVNILLNTLSQKVGLDYDNGGRLAQSGQVLPSILAALNSLDYYQLKAPKSLGYEWVEQCVLPILLREEYPIENLLHTAVLHISEQIAASLLPETRSDSTYRLLVTGGGAYNDFLMACLQKACGTRIHVIKPEPRLIDFKESLIFALLGLLRALDEVNCLSSVTGASRDNSGGVIYGRLNL